MQGVGLRSVHSVLEQADNTANVDPCDRLPEIFLPDHAFYDKGFKDEIIVLKIF
jgi:hypothetical protein